MNLNARSMMKESKIRMPAPNPISMGVAGTTPFTQLTRTTGAVGILEETASVAPVSLTLLAKTIIAPDSMEYLVSGRTIVLKTVKGLAPKVLAASSMSMFILSMAAEIDFTI